MVVPVIPALGVWGQEFKVTMSYLEPSQKQNCCWVWLCPPVIPVLGRVKEDLEFKAGLGYKRP